MHANTVLIEVNWFGSLRYLNYISCINIIMSNNLTFSF